MYVNNAAASSPLAVNFAAAKASAAFSFATAVLKVDTIVALSAPSSPTIAVITELLSDSPL